MAFISSHPGSYPCLSPETHMPTAVRFIPKPSNTGSGPFFFSVPGTLEGLKMLTFRERPREAWMCGCGLGTERVRWGRGQSASRAHTPHRDDLGRPLGFHGFTPSSQWHSGPDRSIHRSVVTKYPRTRRWLWNHLWPIPVQSLSSQIKNRSQEAQQFAGPSLCLASHPSVGISSFGSLLSLLTSCSSVWRENSGVGTSNRSTFCKLRSLIQ